MGQTERVADTKVTKKQVQQRVTHYGVPLALSKFEWDAGTRAFSTVESKLVIDFSGISVCTFRTGSTCTFNTRYGCTFNTGMNCTFNTGYSCAFRTRDDCTFNTGPGCTFNTGRGCTFNTGDECAFYTGGGCAFTTGSDCTFLAGSECTWVIGGRRYSFAPLLIMGSQWPVNVYQPGYLKIGCQKHTFPTWDRDVGKIAQRHDASPEVLAEYMGLIKVAREWAKEKGWLVRDTTARTSAW